MSEYEVKNFGPFKHVVGKLGTMRKPQEFSVMPSDDGETLVVQSDKSIGRFNFKTGEGVLNIKGCYFPHLSGFMGAKPYTFPAEFIAACLAACPALDSETSFGGVTFVNTVKTI
jgi:hypothetical protein